MPATAGLRELERRCCCCSGHVGAVGVVNTPLLSPISITATRHPLRRFALRARLRSASTTPCALCRQQLRLIIHGSPRLSRVS
jgi:hypothetical protein